MRIIVAAKPCLLWGAQEMLVRIADRLNGVANGRKTQKRKNKMNYEKNAMRREREQIKDYEWKRRKEKEVSIVRRLVKATSSHFWCYRIADWILEMNAWILCHIL